MEAKEEAQAFKEEYVPQPLPSKGGWMYHMNNELAKLAGVPLEKVEKWRAELEEKSRKKI